MQILEHKIPPPLLTIAFALLLWWLASLSPIIDINSTIRLFLCMLSVGAGLFCCTAGIVSFNRAKTTVNPLQPELASSLVRSGIYRFSRNPMYLGFALLLLALSIYLASPLSLLAVAAFILTINTLQIKPEERALQSLFGDEYRSYQAEVRRWC